MTAVHVCSIPIVFAPTSHYIVHEVRLCHIHCRIDFNLQKKETITARPLVFQHWFEDESPPATFLLTKRLLEWKVGIFTGQILSLAVTLYLSRPCSCSDRGPECPCSRRTEEDIVRGPVIKQRLWLVLFLQSILFSSIKSWMTFPGSVCMTNTQRVTELIFKQSALCSLQSSQHGWNSLQRHNHHFYHVSLKSDNITRDLQGEKCFLRCMNKTDWSECRR